MSGGDVTLVYPERVEAVSEAAPRDRSEFVRIVRGADLGGGPLKSACFSAPWHARGTLLARSWHATSLKTERDKPRRGELSGTCPRRTCADHAPMLRTRRTPGVPQASGWRTRAVSHAPVLHTRRAVIVPAIVPRWCRQRAGRGRPVAARGTSRGSGFEPNSEPRSTAGAVPGKALFPRCRFLRVP